MENLPSSEHQGQISALSKYFSDIKNAVKSGKFKRHILSGFVIYVISVFSMWVLTRILGFGYFFSLTVLQVIILCLGFVTAKYFVFEEKRPPRVPKDDNAGRYSLKGQFILYSGVYIGFRFADWLLNLLLIEVMNIPYYVSLFVVMGLIFPLKFVVYNCLIFVPAGGSGGKK